MELPFSTQVIETTSEGPLLLLAEDNQLNIETFADYLQFKGYCLILANNGEEAVAIAKTHKPDVIVMDIQMPGIDGLEAIRQIRAEQQIARTPIIALTALAMPGDRERCIAAGANSYLAKPVKLKELVEVIQQLLNGFDA